MPSDQLKAIQRRVGVQQDGVWGPSTEHAVAVELNCLILPTVTGLRDPGAFFASVKSHFGALKQSQVDGFNTLLDAYGDAGWGAPYAANGFGTGWLETNQTMQPVREAYWKDEAWRKANLRYYPWYGRGYVQLTWEDNYRKADAELNLGGTLVAKPDRAMEPGIAAEIMVSGMAHGWFTTKKLGDYLPTTGLGTRDQHKQARRIINGTDRWDDLATYAMGFQEALVAGGWG